MDGRRTIGVDAATNLAALTLNGEVQATMKLEYDHDGEPVVVVESSAALEIHCERAVSVHGAGQ